MLRIVRFLTAAVGLVLLSCGAGFAQSYPTGPVRIVVPYSTGGSSDIMARAIGQKLEQLWNVRVLIENKPGGTTTVGTEYVSKAPPDGYTLLLAPPPFVITTYIYPNLRYDVRKSFAPISLVAYYPLIVVVASASPVKTLKDLVEFARAHPGQTYASPGAGTTPHLIGEMMARREKLDMTHIPYKSGGQGVVDLMGGRLTFYAGVPTEVIPHIQSGQLRPIAVLAETRSKLLPDVPTSTEAGYGYLQSASWTSVVAPAGTPADIINKISADIAKVTQDKEFAEKLTAQGAVFVGSTPKELTAFYETEHERYGPLIKAIGLKPE